MLSARCYRLAVRWPASLVPSAGFADACGINDYACRRLEPADRVRARYDSRLVSRTALVPSAGFADACGINDYACRRLDPVDLSTA
jgi:hypothetical protein